jgi:hypothetical protein
MDGLSISEWWLGLRMNKQMDFRGTTLTMIYAALVAVAPPLIIAAGLYYKVFERADIAAVLAGIASVEIAVLTLWYVRTTSSQLRVMQGQLSEMQRARELAAQPLPTLSLHRFTIERPTLFAPLGRSPLIVQSRYVVDFSLLNKGAHPAVNIDVTFELHPRGAAEDSVRWNCSRIYDSLTEREVIPASGMPYEHAMFPDDTDALLLDSLRRTDPDKGRNFPALLVKIAYKNVNGACFLIQQAYYMFREERPEAEVLANWQLTIQGFAIKYSQDLRNLDDLERRGDRPNMLQGFDELKAKIGESLKESPAKLELAFSPFSDSFRVKTITGPEYEKLVSSHRYGGRIPGWLDKCML